MKRSRFWFLKRKEKKKKKKNDCGTVPGSHEEDRRGLRTVEVLGIIKRTVEG